MTRLDATQWRAALAALPLAQQDVYFTPEYHELHHATGDGVPECWQTSSLLLPALRVPIRDSQCDLQTCNGYGGPLMSATGDRERAWEEWRDEARAAGVVAAFFRLHPLLDQRPWLPDGATIVDDRPTVYVDLTSGLDAMAQRADGRHRNMVSKGRRSGDVVRWNVPEDWDAFVSLYASAMDRLGAPSALRFNDGYFERLRAFPSAQLAACLSEGRLTAAAVFFFGPVWAHYHLSARHDGAGNHVTNVILQAALESAFERGLSGMHLGGGRTPSPDDSLLRFKKTLGGELRTFRVARVIADSLAYNELITQWTRRTGEAPQWLLGYRQPLPKAQIEVKTA